MFNALLNTRRQSKLENRQNLSKARFTKKKDRGREKVGGKVRTQANPELEATRMRWRIDRNPRNVTALFAITTF